MDHATYDDGSCLICCCVGYFIEEENQKPKSNNDSIGQQKGNINSNEDDPTQDSCLRPPVFMFDVFYGPLFHPLVICSSFHVAFLILRLLALKFIFYCFLLFASQD